MTAQHRSDARPVARTGILGGTFNPIHVAHLRAAEEVVERLGLEKMIFVPSARPPHKAEGADDPIAPAADRLAWVRLAVAGNPRFEVDTLEIDRRGPSYLVDTLRTLCERTAPELPVFTLGADAFREIDTWREPAKLLTLAHFAVVTRPGIGRQTLSELFPKNLAAPFEIAADGGRAFHRHADTFIELIEITALDVSASAIRAAIRAGGSVRYMLPESIHDAVLASGCYKTGTQEERKGRKEGRKESRRESRKEGR